MSTPTREEVREFMRDAGAKFEAQRQREIAEAVAAALASLAEEVKAMKWDRFPLATWNEAVDRVLRLIEQAGRKG